MFNFFILPFILICVLLILSYIIYLQIKKLQKTRAKSKYYENLLIEQSAEYQCNAEQILESNETLSILAEEISNRITKKKEIELEIQEIANKIDILNITIKEKEENFAKTESLMREAQAKRLEEEQRLRIEILSKEEEIKIQKLKQESEEKQILILSELEEINKELTSLKEKRDAIIAEQKRREEFMEKQHFHMIPLTENDLNDIQILKSYIAAIHNKSAINKLIWSIYYQPNYKTMVGKVVGSEKTSGIYKITNIKNNKSYIGQSTDIAARWKAHLKTSLGLEGCSRTKIHDALNEEGVQNFTFEILEKCEKSELNEREKYYISFYESNSYGYNSTKGGS